MKTKFYVQGAVATVAVTTSCFLLMNGTSVKTAKAEFPGYFKDVSASLGIPEQPSTRNIWVDINGDGEPDIVSANQFVYLNTKTPKGRRFVKFDAGALARPCGDDKAADLLLFGDLDHDGDNDALAIRFQEPEGKKHKPKSNNAVLINDGQGRFKIKEKSGLEAFQDSIIAGTLLDADHDGHLDVFTGASYRVYGKSLEATENRLLKGSGDGRFVEKTKDMGLALKAKPGLKDSRRPTYGVAHGDWNNDGWTDIFVCSYGRQWNRLWMNKKGQTFEDVGMITHFAGDSDQSGTYPKWTKEFWKKRFGREREDEKPFRANGNTFDAAVADFDNDGDLDVFLSEITHSWAGLSSDRSMLLVNQGKDKGYKFERRPKAIPRRVIGQRWNQGDLHAGWLDFDNDGLQDLLLASSDYPDGQFLQLFRQKPDHSFENVSFAAGLYYEGASQLSFADYDGDGDLDILIGNTFNRLPKALRAGRKRTLTVFENQVGQKNNWIQFQLIGKGAGGSNRSAIGARVTIHCGKVRMIREIRSSLGHAGHGEFPRAHFGLGKIAKVDRVEIRWPNKTLSVQVFDKKVPANRFVTIREGEKEMKVSQSRGK